MCYSRGGVGTFAKEKLLELMLINLWEKEMTGGRSAGIILFCPERLQFYLGLKVVLRTVRTSGADSPQVF